MRSPRRAFEATLLLQRLAASPDADIAAQSPAVLAGMSWEAIIANASAHLVLPALHPGLVRLAASAGHPTNDGVPSDAVEFLGTIRAANGARNRLLCATLTRYAGALNGAGIVPVALKGAGFLLDPYDAHEAGPAAWRFLSDLDILVPQTQAAQAHEIALQLGFTPAAGDYQPVRDAHYPALVSPCDRYAIELHTRIFAEPMMPALESRIISDAEAITRDGARLLRPRLSHRLAHLIGHAQLHHRHWPARRVLLRNLLDVSMLSRQAGGDLAWHEVVGLFAAGEERRSAQAFLALWSAAMAERADGVLIDGEDRAWAEAVIVRLGYPAAVRTGLIMAGLGQAQLRQSWSNSATLGRHFNMLTRPREVARRLGKLVRRTRQMLWA